MRLPSVFAILLLAATSPAAFSQPPRASSAAIPPLPFRERTLSNGLRVFSVVDRTTPNVTIQVFYDVGGKDDPEHRSGFAHLFEHMMFKATRDMPSEYMDRLTEDVGGFNNASTADDLTNYFEVVPANHLERLLWAEAERMSSLKVDQAAFASERAVVEEELRQRVLADPYGRLQSLLVPESSFQVHPYKRAVIGSIPDLDAATLADVQAFHATFYRPDNANLIVIGNFDPATLDRWVDRYFAGISHPAAPIPRVTAVEPPRTGPRVVTGYGPTVPLPALAWTFLAPAASSPDGAALTVADAILTTGHSSRLYRNLVYQQQLAQDVFSSADLRQQPGLFQAGLIMASGKTLDAGEAALRAELEQLRDRPVSEAELARAKNQLIAQILRERETVDGQAAELGRAIVLEGGAAKVNTDISDLQAVSALDVQRVARLYLKDKQRVVIRYLPESLRPPGGDIPSRSQPSATVAALTPTTARSAPPPESLPHTPPAPGPIVSPSPPMPATRVLRNGLKVIVARTSALPIVTAELVVRSGATSDPTGMAGLQGLTASLLTQGAGGRTAPQIAADIEALGGTLESGGGTDGSQIVLTVLADQLDTAMPILADVTRRPTFAPAEIDRLRRQRLDELAVQMDEPGALARLALRPLVFGASPYGHNPAGTPASLKRIDRQAVLRQYASAYRPDEAILILTGDITPDQGLALAERSFGDWAPPSTPRAPRPELTPFPKSRVVVIDLPGTGQAAVLAGAPSIARSDPRFYAAEVASAVLGGGFSARLNEELRIRRGLSYGAGSNIDEFRDTGLFAAAAQTKNASAQQVASLMQAQIAGLSAAPIPATELEARQAGIVGEFGRSVATSAGLAGQIAANYALYGLDADEIARFTSRIDAVSAGAARMAASGAIRADRTSLIIAGDAKLFLPELRKAFPDLQVIEAARLDLDSPTLETP
ncbi:pitrilysin family protein [Caulobacter sp. S45]|uniref:M16 family metallopeptidase n=1 Tax=Caulobacter sp. S45 TaxID=1641861 RepID=UPI001575FF43|nr:pitrilysin family protein [Caulobacter sp. S45]